MTAECRCPLRTCWRPSSGERSWLCSTSGAFFLLAPLLTKIAAFLSTSPATPDGSPYVTITALVLVALLGYWLLIGLLPSPVQGAFFERQWSRALVRGTCLHGGLPGCQPEAPIPAQIDSAIATQPALTRF